MLERVLQSELLRQAEGRIAPGRTLTLTGVWGSSATLIAAALGRLRNAPVLVVVPHLDDADAAVDDLDVFLKRSSGPARVFPAWEAQLATDHVSHEVTGERLRLLNLLSDPAAADEAVDYVVAPVLAMLQPVPTPEALAAGRLRLSRGEAISPEQFRAWLLDAGYEHVEQVDQQGEFAHRGGIVDVFPPAEPLAVRVEFFGDELESIRTFDLDTQRSRDELHAYDLTAMTIGESLDRLAGQPAADLTRRMTHLLDYLPSETVVFLHQPRDIRQLAEQLYDRIRDDLAEEASPVALRGVEEVFSAMDRFACVHSQPFSGAAEPEAMSMGVRSLQRLAINTTEALAELEDLAQAADVWVYCQTPAERERFEQTIREHHPRLGPSLHLGEGHVTAGFHWPALRLVVVGHAELYHRFAKTRRIRRIRPGRPIQSLLDLHEGDWVVHVGHGIAKFDGLRRMERDGATEEYLRLRFAGNAVLHVPAGQIQLVQKYVGAKGRRPSLSKLGGKHWARAKQRAAEAVQDLAADLLRVQASRRATPGVSYPAGTDLQRQLAEEFPYPETEDQQSALKQIDADLAAAQPMDRLICGDVGYGKTELAMRAALKIVEAGKQVAVLVPTTVLAEQHYRTFSERFADFPVVVEMLSRFRTPSQQAAILRRLRRGQIDVLIGTHRLLSKDVHFPDLGLVVIDEEQRFGVKHKEQLKRLRTTLDVLTLTATPIPRTLHMSLLGLRDISSLQTPPLDRRAIHTEVCSAEEKLIRTAMLRELNRGGQVFFVHNRVRDIDAVAQRVRALAPDARVAVGHGQLPERTLERVMLRFSRQEIDVLVCTTIIESGLDIPTANTMILHEADRFGLAEMHQLRGRVGRYKHRAYCYLLLPERRTVNPAAAKRLKAIEDFSDLGAGFQIAMRDLEIRGAGNLLGPEQSGYIAAVGYEMYCRLLEQSVRALKGQPVPPERHVHIELGLDAYVSRSYIPSDRQRMEVYRRLGSCASVEELGQLQRDLADSYGPLPEEVQRLLDLGELRFRAGLAGIESIVCMPPDVIFRVRDHRKSEPVFSGLAGSVRLPDDQSVYWRPPKVYLERITLLRVLVKRFRETKG